MTPASGRQFVAKFDPKAPQTFKDCAALGIGHPLDGAVAFGGFGPGIYV
jgi:hypothetical protein